VNVTAFHWALLLLGLLILSVGAVEILRFRRYLDRREQELATLAQISEILRSGLDLDRLLQAIHAQVSTLLGVDHFFVAIYDAEKRQIDYPLAVKFGERVYWQARPLADRLTDRVIQERRPLLWPQAGGEVEMLRGDTTPTAWIGVPLILSQEAVGCLAVFSLAAGAQFDRRELQLLLTLSGPVGVAVDNALLHARTDSELTERLHQLAILETIGRELAAASHSERVFEMVLDAARTYTHSPWGALLLYNPATQQLDRLAACGYPSHLTTFEVNAGICGRVFRTGEAALVYDPQSDPDYLDLWEGRAQVDLAVPLVYEGRTVGVLSLESYNRQAYPPEVVSFIVQLANQAAIALANASLYGATQRRWREQSTLYLVSAALAAHSSLAETMETVGRALTAAIEGAHGGLYLWDASEQTYHLQPHLWGAAGLALPRSLAPDVIWQEEVVLRQAIDPDPQGLRGACQACRVLIFPVGHVAAPAGLLVVHAPTAAPLPTGEDWHLLLAIAAQCRLALQRARVYDEVMLHRQRLERVLNSVDEGILLLEADGAIVLTNSPLRALVGLAPDATWSDNFERMDDVVLAHLGFTQGEVHELLGRLGRDRPAGAVSVIYQPPAAEADERFIERVALPVVTASGEPEAWALVFRDVTEAHALAQAREVITETIIHDLRSPLSAILGSLDMIADELSAPSEPSIDFVLKATEVAQRGSQRINNLVESLLEIARLQTGKLDLVRTPVNLRALTQATLTDYVTAANEYDLRLIEAIPPDLPPVWGDTAKLARVIANLVDNAIKFTPSGGEICLDAARWTDGRVILRVSDTGPGVPPEYRAQIFERFTQVPGRRGRRRGTGLGLTFCQLVVEGLDGEIWVEPRPGGGSVFALTLPSVGA
jgi:signal transduction histidine kinase/transcriptional regulator with GAF, ATPase, and Fis domain